MDLSLASLAVAGEESKGLVEASLGSEAVLVIQSVEQAENNNAVDISSENWGRSTLNMQLIDRFNESEHAIKIKQVAEVDEQNPQVAKKLISENPLAINAQLKTLANLLQLAYN